MTTETVKDFPSYFERQKEEIHHFLDSVADHQEEWIHKNQYYYLLLQRLLIFHIPPEHRVCHFGCDSGHILRALSPSEGVGICLSEKFVKICTEKFPEFSFHGEQWEETLTAETFDYIILTNLSYIFDVRNVLEHLYRLCHHRTKILIANYNYLWKFMFTLGEKLHLWIPQPLQRQNWIPTHKIMNMLRLSGVDTVRWDRHILIPFPIPLLSWFCNKFLSRLFPFNLVSMIHIVVARVQGVLPRPIRCSIVIPCRNERGHITTIVERMGQVGDETELVFVDDCSTDGTSEEIRRCMKQYPDKNIRCVQGPGVSKGEAVRAGFHAVTGDLLVIFDADIAVTPEELPKCVNPIIRGYADFVNTVRFVYPQQSQAMRWLNILGNKMFALIFSFLLQQRIGDTLCGTKIFWKKDYENIERYKDYWIWRDRWGDFEQLLGASRLGLKIVDVPVHYMKRTYGETKMKKRLQNGLLMLKLCLAGLFKLRLR